MNYNLQSIPVFPSGPTVIATHSILKSKDAEVHEAHSRVPKFIYVGRTPLQELSCNPVINVRSSDCILKETVFKIKIPHESEKDGDAEHFLRSTASNLVDISFQKSL